MGSTGIQSEVSARVRTVLELRHRSRQSLAHETGIPNTTLHRKLSGQADFTITELAAVAEALGVPGSSLLPDELAHERGADD